MSRRRRRSSHPGRASPTPIASLGLPREFLVLDELAKPARRAFYPSETTLPDLRLFEDRRTWKPGYAPPSRLEGRRLDSGVVPLFHITPARKNAPGAVLGVPRAIAFAKPEQVAVCIRRERRREVLHAHGVAGSHGLRGGRRGALSGISCKGKR